MSTSRYTKPMATDRSNTPPYEFDKTIDVAARHQHADWLQLVEHWRQLYNDQQRKRHFQGWARGAPRTGPFRCPIILTSTDSILLCAMIYMMSPISNLSPELTVPANEKLVCSSLGNINLLIGDAKTYPIASVRDGPTDSRRGGQLPQACVQRVGAAICSRIHPSNNPARRKRSSSRSSRASGTCLK